MTNLNEANVAKYDWAKKIERPGRVYTPRLVPDKATEYGLALADSPLKKLPIAPTNPPANTEE